MAYEFKLPDIGEGVVEGEIVRWLVKEGDVVREDQPMVEIMTDKATVEIPSPKAGRVAKRMYAEGQSCRVGKVLITIEEEAASAVVAGKTAAPVSQGRAAVAQGIVAAAPGPRAVRAPEAGRAQLASTSVASSDADGAAVLATPATRKLARELQVNLGTVAATGPGGRVTSEDVRARADAAASGVPAITRSSVPPPGARGDVRIPFRGLRRKIAEHLVHSKHQAAHFTYVEEINCSALVALREKANQRLAPQGVKLSYLPFIIKAVVDALKKFPQLNATLDEKASEIVQRGEYHIGLASATGDGLVVPVVRNADKKSVVDLARDIDRLAAATKAGKAMREDLSGSTFTITSLGALGGVLATPIINFPEVAILGVHKIARKPAVVGDAIAIRHLMNLSISVDHRLVDGYDAARFVAEIKESLEDPALVFLESV